MNGITLQIEDKPVTLLFDRGTIWQYYAASGKRRTWRGYRSVRTLVRSFRRNSRYGGSTLQPRNLHHHHPAHHACERGLAETSWQRLHVSELGKPQTLLRFSLKGARSSPHRLCTNSESQKTGRNGTPNFARFSSGRTRVQRIHERRQYASTLRSARSTWSYQRASRRSRPNEIYSWAIKFDYREHSRSERTNDTKRLAVCPSVASQGTCAKIWNAGVTRWGLDI